MDVMVDKRTIDNYGDFLNQGNIEVSFSNGLGSCNGMRNDKNMTNDGTIDINVISGGVNGTMLINSGGNARFVNNGTVSIDNITNNSGFGYGLVNSGGGFFENNKLVHTSGIGNWNANSEFINRDFIQSSLVIANSGEFSNTSGATIDLDYTISNRLAYIANASNFSGGSDFGIFNNQGEIFINSNTYGIYNSGGGIFNNENKIDITEATNGIYFGGIADNLSEFNNTGTISMDNISSHGIYNSIFFGVDFQNEGVIEMSNVGGNGIYFLRHPNGPVSFTNFGSIELISSINGDGIYSSAPFINETNGSIKIHSSGNDAAITSWFLFTNKGLIDIDLDIGGAGLNIQGSGVTFDNQQNGSN